MPNFKSFGYMIAASALMTVASSASAFAENAFDDCSCVTAPSAVSGGVGEVVSSNGEVLVNNVSASGGQVLSSPSEIVVGSGAVAYSVGFNCAAEAGENSIVSISQPAGPDGNICVKVTSVYAQENDSGALLLNGGSAPNVPLGIFAGLSLGAGIVAVADEDRDPASP